MRHFETFSNIFLQVLLPVPDYVYTLLPLDQMKTMTFSLTPVFFNIGINEKATIAHKMGNNGPQEKNNIDNFKTLAEYYRRFKRINLSTKQHKNKRKYCHTVRNLLFLSKNSALIFQENCGNFLG